MPPGVARQKGRKGVEDGRKIKWKLSEVSANSYSRTVKRFPGRL